MDEFLSDRGHTFQSIEDAAGGASRGSCFGALRSMPV